MASSNCSYSIIIIISVPSRHISVCLFKSRAILNDFRWNTILFLMFDAFFRSCEEFEQKKKLK